MLRYARIIETADHQFLIRACQDPQVAGIREEIPGWLGLTIDTVHPLEGDKYENFRLILHCNIGRHLVALFNNFTAADARNCLTLLLACHAGQLTREEIKELTDLLSLQLLARAGATPEEITSAEMSSRVMRKSE